jgi:selenocysteine lyase/cysteine desulfurase
MKIDPLLSPDMFVGIEGIAHLCTGGEGPWLKTQRKVYDEFARLKGESHTGRATIYERGERCRERMGQMWNVPAKRIALMPSAAEGMGWFARGLDWQDGDNVVTTNLEFPSVAYAWRHIQARGVEIRVVRHRDWCVDEGSLIDAMDSRTRVLAISHVSFYTGQCHDLARLSEAAEKNGTLFAVDATHSAGAIVVDAGLSDLTTSSSYKWLLTTHGVAPTYLSERAEGHVASTCFGWHNLDVWPIQTSELLPAVDEMPMPERMEPGNPSMQVIMHLDLSLETLLSLGRDRIQAHDRALAERVHAGLRALGLTVISPEGEHRRSGNTCFLVEDAERMTAELAKQNVLVWGEFGRVRVSTHVHNGSEDVERLLDTLRVAAVGV